MSETLKFGNGVWAVKKGSTLAYNDTNGNYKPLPFTFDRSTSATRVNKEGLIEVVSNNEPRIDFKDSSEGALLLEPSRSNLLTYSEDFTQSYWSKIGSSISPNISISPDGTQNASKLIEDNLNGLKRLRINAISTSGDNTLSFFVKSAERKWILLREAGQTGAYAFFDLENGVIGQSNLAENIEIKQFNNDWYRISFKDSVTSVAIELRLALSDGVQSYQGDGTSGLYIWGAQLEQGSYATSYIPTQGSIGTRVAESCNQTPVSGIIGQTEGTLFAEFEYFGNTYGALEISPIYIGSGTYANAIYADVYQGKLYAVCFNSGVNQASINCGVLSVGTHKVAIGYSNNDIVIYLDGLLGGIDTSATIPKCNRVYLGTVGTSTSVQKYTQSKAQLYNTRLSNSELQALTTI